MMRLSTRLLVVAAAVGTSASGSEQSLLRRMAGDGANDVTEELPRGAKNGNDKFMDALKSVTDEQKVSLFLHARALERVSEHVDWERLRDNYLTATYTFENRRRRLKGSKDEPKKQGKNKDLEMKKVEAELENEVKMAVDMAFPKTPPNGHGAKNRDKNKDSETSFGVPNANISGEKSQRLIDSAVQEGSVANNSPQIHEHDVSQGHSPPGSGHKSPRAIAPKKAQRIGTNMALQFEVPTPDSDTSQPSIEVDPVKDNQGRAGNDDGIIIPNYEYSTGNCPEDGDSTNAVPCAPANLNQICDKTDPDDQGKFSLCFDACLPSFCCIHDAPPSTNFVSPNCNTDVNCAAYSCCYIVWWKLHDTIGPATQLRLEANDDFFDVPADFIEGDVTNVQFYREMLFHHFDDAQEIIRLGTVQVNESLAVFDSDVIFLNSTYWNTTI